MKDMVVACTAGFIEATPIMDLNYVEESSGGPCLPLAVMPKRNEVVLAQMDAKLPLDVFEAVLETARQACDQVHTVLSNELREHASKMLSCRLGI